MIASCHFGLQGERMNWPVIHPANTSAHPYLGGNCLCFFKESTKLMLPSVTIALSESSGDQKSESHQKGLSDRYTPIHSSWYWLHSDSEAIFCWTRTIQMDSRHCLVNAGSVHTKQTSNRAICLCAWGSDRIKNRHPAPGSVLEFNKCMCQQADASTSLSGLIPPGGECNQQPYSVV